jgi:hypothetical protein
MGFLIAKPATASKPRVPRVVEQPVTQQDVEAVTRYNALAYETKAPQLQFHAGELQDLQSAVRTWLLAYKNRLRGPELLAKGPRMHALLAKLEGMA